MKKIFTSKLFPKKKTNFLSSSIFKTSYSFIDMNVFVCASKCMLVIVLYFYHNIGIILIPEIAIFFTNILKCFKILLNKHSMSSSANSVPNKITKIVTVSPALPILSSNKTIGPLPPPQLRPTNHNQNNENIKPSSATKVQKQDENLPNPNTQQAEQKKEKSSVNVRHVKSKNVIIDYKSNFVNSKNGVNAPMINQKVNIDIKTTPNNNMAPRSENSNQENKNPSPNAQLYQKLLKLVSESNESSPQLSFQMSTLLSNPNIKTQLKKLHNQLLQNPNEYIPKLETILQNDSKNNDSSTQKRNPSVDRSDKTNPKPESDCQINNKTVLIHKKQDVNYSMITTGPVSKNN